MSVSVEASQLTRRCAEPVHAGESIKALIRKVSRKTGLPASRVKGFWYQEAKAIRAEELDLLRRKAGAEPAITGEPDAAHRELLELRNEVRDQIANLNDLAGEIRFYLARLSDVAGEAPAREGDANGEARSGNGRKSPADRPVAEDWGLG